MQCNTQLHRFHNFINFSNQKISIPLALLWFLLCFLHFVPFSTNWLPSQIWLSTRFYCVNFTTLLCPGSEFRHRFDTAAFHCRISSTLFASSPNWLKRIQVILIKLESVQTGRCTPSGEVGVKGGMWVNNSHLAQQWHLARAYICISMPLFFLLSVVQSLKSLFTDYKLTWVTSHIIVYHFEMSQLTQAQVLTCCFLCLSKAWKGGGSTNQKEIWKETQNIPPVSASTFRTLCVQSQGPQPVWFPQLRWRAILTGILYQTTMNHCWHVGALWY